MLAGLEARAVADAGSSSRGRCWKLEPWPMLAGLEARAVAGKTAPKKYFQL